MIVRGHLPAYGFKINEDAKKLLQYLLPKGTPSNRVTLSHACKHLHLAFKGYEAGEIYNVLAACLLRVVNKYDPFYVEKVADVVGVIKHQLGRIRQFSVYQLNQELPFETRYIVRMLVKKGFLEQVSLAPKKLVYKRVKGLWPPPAGFFSVGRIGLPYYVEQWFSAIS
jgi:hypothetical protein